MEEYLRSVFIKLDRILAKRQEPTSSLGALRTSRPWMSLIFVHYKSVLLRLMLYGTFALWF
jgi:hypothetical protein